MGWFCFGSSIQLVEAAVNLRYFRAKAQETKITIEWGTATELDNAGFYVQRSNASNGTFQRISPFIYAQGDSLTGSDYDYDDLQVDVGITYWYRLESVDSSQRSSFNDPVSVGFKLPALTSTPTSTPTHTATITPTRSNRPDVTLRPTDISATNALTPIPTEIQDVPDATEEPTLTEQTGLEPESTEIVSTAVNTLIPFPTITIQFPKQFNQIIRTPFDGYQRQIVTPETVENPGGVLGRYIIYILLLAIWLLLGYWLLRITRAGK
jgi:hypothetical protein